MNSHLGYSVKSKASFTITYMILRYIYESVASSVGKKKKERKKII